MNLFRKAGEKFEETKQAFMSGESSGGHVCRSCEEPVEGDAERCPHCGEETVEEVE